MLKNFIKRSVKKSTNNFTRMTGLNAPIKMARSIFDLVRKFLGISNEVYPHETYEELMNRLGYTPEQRLSLQKAYFKQAALFFVCALFVLGYGVYLIANQSLFPAFVTGLCTLMLFTYSFRAHFTYFQLKNKKLGCTFKEWLNASVKGAE